MKNQSITYRRAFLATCAGLLLTVSSPAGSRAEADATVSAAADNGTLSGSGKGSVLEMFRVYSGPRSKDALRGLFTLPADPVIRQQPLIAISDGRTAVLIAVKVPSADGVAPSFAFEGAKLLSLERRQRDEWLLKALPQPGVLQVSLLMMNGSEAHTFQLTVAPPLPQNIDAGSQEFGSFLETSATPESPHDLNGDGRHDYIDDYIYMANLLASERESGRDLPARRERALKRTLSQPSVPESPGN